MTTSDIESLSIDDNQLDALMNKSDLSDLDQLDTKTITGSCSSLSDEVASMMDHHLHGAFANQTGSVQDDPDDELIRDTGHHNHEHRIHSYQPCIYLN